MDESPREAMDESPLSLAAEIKRRMIIVATMDRDLRVTFATGGLTLFVALIVDVLRDQMGPPVRTFAGTIPLGALAVYTTGQFLVFTLLFAGLLQTQRRVRAIGFAIFSAVIFLAPALNDFHAAELALLLPSVALWAHAETRRSTAPLRLREAFAPSAAASALLTAIFVAFGALGGDAVLIELSSVAAMLTQIGLYMASTDVAELVQVGAEIASDAVERHRRARWRSLLIAIVAIAISIAATTVVLPHDVPQNMGGGLAVILWYGLIYWALLAVGKRLTVTPHIPYRLLLGVVVVYSVALQGAGIARVLANPLTYDAAQLFTYEQVNDVALLLFLAFIAAFLTIGHRSVDRYLFFGYGSCVGVLWFINFSNHGALFFSITYGVAIGSLLFLAVAAAWPKTRERFAAVCGLVVALNLAFAGFETIASVYLATPQHLGEGTALQALIVLIALGWDILTSGTVTNGHSPTIPRSARACFFIGYIASVALFVMMSSAARLIVPWTGARVERIFDSEGLVAVGLMLFGAPLILFVFALRMRGVLAAAVEAEPAEALQPT